MGGTSAFWQVNSRNKKSIVVDLNKKNGIAVFEDLVKCCDLIILSMRPGSLEARGIDEEKLKRLNPRLVIVSCPHLGAGDRRVEKAVMIPSGQGCSELQLFHRGARWSADARGRRHSGVRLYDGVAGRSALCWHYLTTSVVQLGETSATK